MKKRFYSSVFTSLLVMAFATQVYSAPNVAAIKPQVLNFSSGTGSVTFQAVGRPAAIKINGEGEGPKGSLKITDRKLSGDLSFNLTTLKTGIEMRDNHMKEKYLEVEKFPQSKLSIENLEIPADFNHGDEAHLKAVPFKGKLLLKNTTKEVQGTCDVDRKKQNTDVVAQFTIKLPDYGIEIPKYMGITVAEDVNVKVATKTPLQDEK
jgi:polyisoprenoid-binding protein YceI